jgi:hypothetical protein
MTFSAGWYTQHPSQEKTPASLDGISLEQFDGLVKRASTSNQEREADAIRIADGHTFLAANAFWFKNTASNRKLVDNWLNSHGITNSTYPDVIEATEALAKAGLLDVDEAGFAQYLDGHRATKFKSSLTGKTYDSFDSLLLQDRDFQIKKSTAEQPTDLQCAFDHLPADDAKALLNDAMRKHQAIADGKISQQNADSWLTLNPTWRDDETNAKLMREQLILNGVTGVVTVNDYQIAERQLVAAGLVRQNPAALRQQAAQEVLDRAERAVKTSAAFDKTTEEEAYALPLDEVRRRANNNYTGIGF